MYFRDFFKKVVRKSNSSVLIYLILNVLVITGFLMLLFSDTGKMTYGSAFIIGLVAYAISLYIALSPVGEWLVRKQTGCEEIGDEQLAFIEPIFKEVYEKAKMSDPSIPDDVKLFINEEEGPNAFATGRKTICITKGLLNIPKEQIKATLGHEFGHLAHRDTDLILVVAAGNFIVSALIVAFRILIEFVRIFGKMIVWAFGNSEGILGSVVTDIYCFLLNIFVVGFTWLWTKLGIILVMKSSRENEYEADAFSFNLGYGNALCEFLDSLHGNPKDGLFASLANSHPDKDERIARLSELGATYKNEKNI